MAKFKYPKRRFGGDRRSLKPIAGTSNDRRCRIDTQINNETYHCSNGNRIRATQVGSIVKVRCSCHHRLPSGEEVDNYEVSVRCEGIFADRFHALSVFTDHHHAQFNPPASSPPVIDSANDEDESI